MIQKNIFKMYDNCKVVSGPAISIICDLQKRNFVYIPEGLNEIITLHQEKTIDEVKSNYDVELHQTIDDYFDYLIRNQFIFFTSIDNSKYFEKLRNDFEEPFKISNAIIDFDRNSNHNYNKIFNELGMLGTPNIEFRFFEIIKLGIIDDILINQKSGRCLYMSILLKYTEEITEESLNSLFLKYQFIGQFIVHSSPFSKIIDDYYPFNILFTKQEIIDESCCGNISKKNFSVNISHYNEALQFNTCLNKKISIDKEGNIKNCPSLKTSFGNVKNDSLVEVALNNKAFADYWNINKDQIKVCKDCQFRYICTDCRAFVEDKFDKPKKCRYDPYTNKWN